MNRSEPSRTRRSWAGALGATAALAVGQFVSSIDTTGPTLIDAVGSGFIDRFAAVLKDLAVAIFGVHDKTALIVGVWAVALGIAALAARSSRTVEVSAWTAAVIIGLGAFVTRPESSVVVGIAATTFAVIAGASVRWFIARTSEPTSLDDTIMPGTATGNRRQFLTLAGATVAGSAALVALGRVIHERTPTVAKVLGIPEPGTRVDVPADTGISVEGLSDYITPIEDFYRIDTALRVPRIDPASWTLTIDGMVNQPLTIGYDALLAEEAVAVPVTIACVSNQIGGDLVGTAIWQGVPLERVLARAGVDPAATQIIGHSSDGFTAGMPTAVALDGRTALIAYAMNGEPLPERHGFPARLIVAGLYGYVSATKWLTRIELTTMEAVDGYWIPRGWAKQAPVKLASRIDVPSRGTLDAGTVPIAGVAWAPDIGISAVEVAIDDGPWMLATLGRVASDDTWVQWLLPWEAMPGDHTITVRAIDRDGLVQTDEITAVAPDGATGHHRRRITIR